MSAATSLHTTLLPGGAPRVVFLHGLFGQGKNLTAIAKGLAPEHGALLVDLPNHGRSGWTERVDYVEMAEAVAAAIRAALPEQRVAVVGHSMGGKVAMVLAMLHPGLVERLAVIDISPADSGGMSEFAYYLDSLAALDLDSARRRSDVDSALAAAVPDDRVRGFLLQNLRQEGGRWRWQPNLDLLRRDLPSIGSFPDLTAAAPFTGPTLWIAGEHSPYVRPEHDAPMRALFPKTRRTTVRDSGHWVHSEQPTAVIGLLQAWLARPAAPMV